MPSRVRYAPGFSPGGFSITRGARSRNCVSMRSTQRSPGSLTCESAEISLRSFMALPPSRRRALRNQAARPASPRHAFEILRDHVARVQVAGGCGSTLRAAVGDELLSEPIRSTVFAGCASAASGTATGPTERTARNPRRSISCMWTSQQDQGDDGQDSEGSLGVDRILVKATYPCEV